MAYSYQLNTLTFLDIANAKPIRVYLLENPGRKTDAVRILSILLIDPLLFGQTLLYIALYLDVSVLEGRHYPLVKI